MLRSMLFILSFSAATALAQSGVFIEHYKLRDFQCTKNLAGLLMQAAFAGKIQAYGWDASQPVKLAGADISKQLKMASMSPQYESWNLNSLYFPGDRVEYEDQIWEAVNDLREGTRPQLGGDYWVRVNERMYYQPSDIDELRVEYAISASKRVNLWIHLSISAENTSDYMGQDILSVGFDEAEKYLETTPHVFYNFSNSDLGWIVGDIFSWDDEYYQSKLIKALGDYAYRDRTDCKIHLSISDLFELMRQGDELLVDPFIGETASQFKVDFRWKGNVLDSIRLYQTDYSKTMRVADVPFKAFQKSLMAKNIRFKGFVNLSSAIKLNILKPKKVDTVSLLVTGNLVAEKASSTKKGTTTNYQYNQSLFCPLDGLGNQFMIMNKNNFGSYITKAIVGWTFDANNIPYQNDSLTSMISRAELSNRIIAEPRWNLEYWNATVNYIAGDAVIYKDKAYRCLQDDNNRNPPPDAPRMWEPFNNADLIYSPRDFRAARLHYRCTLNVKGKLQSRMLYAVSISVYDDKAAFFKPIMTVSASTLKKILSNSEVGTSGLKLWTMLEQGKLSGFVSDSSPIIKTH
jgi:hypothetical protein